VNECEVESNTCANADLDEDAPASILAATGWVVHLHTVRFGDEYICGDDRKHDPVQTRDPKSVREKSEVDEGEWEHHALGGLVAEKDWDWVYAQLHIFWSVLDTWDEPMTLSLFIKGTYLASVHRFMNEREEYFEEKACNQEGTVLR
jgi:hypothetical protein